MIRFSHVLFFLLVALSFPLAAAGCSHKEYLAAQAIATPDVTVTPLEIWIGGKKLWVRLSVQNNAKSAIIVNRDAMTAHLANGQTVTRASGAYTQHEPYVIVPGSAHPVFVEFEEQGFAWRDVGGAQIDFTNAITKDSQPVSVPLLVVRN